MAVCRCPYAPFEQLSKKDQNYWSQKDKPMTKLPAPLSLKKYIVEYANKQGYSGFGFSGPLETETEIEEAHSDMLKQIGYDAQQDIMDRKWKTNIPPAFSRHCETESVAIKDNYGNYIGFTRYFDGGKHFDAYSWYDESVQYAYYLTCEEKEVLTIERTWTKV